jgi:predicted dehydrogenase
MKSGKKEHHKIKFSRRDIVKGLASLPILGIFGYFASKDIKSKKKAPKNIYSQSAKKWNLDENFDRGNPINSAKGDRINVGIIGFGWQGQQLAKALGFVHPEWIEKNKNDRQGQQFLQDFFSQYRLNVRIRAICDLYKPREQKAIETSKNNTGPQGGYEDLEPAKKYNHYKDLLADPEIDAVMIATPDFWHAEMVREAVKAGKHIYCEKPMTIDLQDAIEIHKKVKESGLTFQLGHQNYQQVSHIRARELYKKDVLGNLNLVEFTANRHRVGKKNYNYPSDIRKEIDWKAFQEILPVKQRFDPLRFFHWYHFFDYCNGVAGSMLSHEYASANQILNMGIPETATSSGGRYVSRFNAEIPDVFHTIFEYPEKEFSFLYSLTYGNSRARGRWIQGIHGSMQVGSDVVVYPEKNSTRYPNANPLEPIYEYKPTANVDAVSSPTQKYFAKKGLMYTYRYGKRLDTLHLHVKEWIDSIRNETRPSCNINLSFDEAVTCIMSHKSFTEKCTVKWDPQKQQIIPASE